MRKLSFFAPALLLFSVALSAQSVDDIIAKNIAAKGGLAKLKSINTLRITGNFETGGMQAGFSMVEKRPNRMRRDITIQGLNMVQAYDGQNGWQIIPFTGKKDPEPVGGDELKQFEEEADIDGPLVDYKQKGHKVELIGKEKVEGTDAYNLKITLKNGNVRNVYIDADSFLEIKAVGKVQMRGNEVTFNSSLGDYKQVEGVMIPFSIETRQEGGEASQKITIEKVEFNVPVDDASFKQPPPTPAPAPKEQAEPAPKTSGEQPKKPDTATKPPLMD